MFSGSDSLSIWSSKNIVWLFGIAAGVVLVYFVVRFLLKKKKKEKQQSIENKVVDVDVVDKEN